MCSLYMMQRLEGMPDVGQTPSPLWLGLVIVSCSAKTPNGSSIIGANLVTQSQ